MRLPRFRVRTLMIAVAVVAVPLGVCAERRSRFLGIAAWHRNQADEIRFELRRGRMNGEVLTRRQAHLRAKSLRHHRYVESVYREAALRPWFRVALDPPRPMGEVPFD